MSYYEEKADKFVFRAQKGLLYSRDEVWVSSEGGVLRMGVTDFAQRRGGDIVFADMSSPAQISQLATCSGAMRQ